MESTFHLKRLCAVAACALALLACILAMPTAAHAESTEDQDIILGVFFTGDDDYTDTIYASYDGINMYAISDTYNSISATELYFDNWSGDAGSEHYGHTDPGIIYKDGLFWMLSGWNNQDGNLGLMISYSSDLIHWSFPEGYKVTMTAPTIDGVTYSDFDTVAPDWYLSEDGNVYVVFSAGYYGDFHGEWSNDTMVPYIAKITTISASAPTSSTQYFDDGEYFWPIDLQFSCDTPERINISGSEYIDGSLYEEGQTKYLIIKKDGLINQIYKNTSFSANGWQRVNANASFGYEGPSVAELNGTYFMYTDLVPENQGGDDVGVRVFTSSSMETSSGWTGPGAVHFVGLDGSLMSARHGSVITLKADTEEWTVVKNLLEEAQGVTQPEGVQVYRLYNSATSEHLYTTTLNEYAQLPELSSYWQQEGTAWSAPETSDRPVYRLYNPISGDHHYTTDENEKDTLIADYNWQPEGIACYSADASEGISVYRLYNSGLQKGQHHFTISENEYAVLPPYGWQQEGTAWYALAS